MLLAHGANPDHSDTQLPHKWSFAAYLYLIFTEPLFFTAL